MTTPVTSKPFFHLIVGDGNNINVDNASVPVRWCLNQPMIDGILEYAKKSPVYVCLTALHPKISGSGYEELSRVIVPITDAMTYLMINRPGKFFIHASIIVHEELLTRKGVVAKHMNKLLERNNKTGKLTRSCHVWPEEHFEDRIRHSTGETISVLHKLRRSGCDIEEKHVTDIVECFCPEELFASPLPKWLVDWVNMPFDSKMIDQCSFRRRLILFILITSWGLPLVMSLFYVTYFSVKLLLGLTANFLGFTNIKWNRFGESFADFTDDWHWTNMYLKHKVLIPLHPLLWVPEYYTVMWLADLNWALGFQWLLSLLSGGWGTILVLLATITVVAIVVDMLMAFCAPICDVNYKSPIWRGLPAKLVTMFDNWLHSQSDYDVLLCGGDPLKIVADPKSLPKPRTKVNILYNKVKSKICKPMAL